MIAVQMPICQWNNKTLPIEMKSIFSPNYLLDFRSYTLNSLFSVCEKTKKINIDFVCELLKSMHGKEKESLYELSIVQTNLKFNIIIPHHRRCKSEMQRFIFLNVWISGFWISSLWNSKTAKSYCYTHSFGTIKSKHAFMCW